MKRAIALTSLLLLSSAALAAGKTYQVTGPIVEVRPDAIVVQKDKEKWEIARDASTKVSGGDLKLGAKVTVKYTMSATDVEVKEEKKKDEKKPVPKKQ